eukprot:2852859-Amphidinium_carterae.1
MSPMQVLGPKHNFLQYRDGKETLTELAEQSRKQCRPLDAKGFRHALSEPCVHRRHMLGTKRTF